MKHNFFIRPIVVLLIVAMVAFANNSFGRDIKKSSYDHRIISFNPGFAFSGDGDCWGIGTEISHMKTIAPRLYHRESISSWLINGSSWISPGFEHQSAYDFTVEMGISPFKMKNHLISFTGGGCIANQNFRSPETGGWWSYKDGGYKTMIRYRTVRYIDPGFTMGLNYHSRVNSKLWINARAATRFYYSGNVVSILSVGIGFDPIKF